MSKRGERFVLKKILIGFCFIIAAIVGLAAIQPADFRTERSASMNAPIETVFEQINDLHKWESWSPWAKLDPQAKITFSGPPSGPGASYTWAGNSDVGAGQMTITRSVPPTLVQMNLEFTAPFAAVNTTEFTLKSDGSQTTVTWAMWGKNNLIAKIFGLFVDCDKMIGGDFETGLATLKRIVETKPTN
jgi:uncharacterized protein YndB with AHSA1/START domain